MVSSRRTSTCYPLLGPTRVMTRDSLPRSLLRQADSQPQHPGPTPLPDKKFSIRLCTRSHPSLSIKPPPLPQFLPFALHPHPHSSTLAPSLSARTSHGGIPALSAQPSSSQKGFPDLLQRVVLSLVHAYCMKGVGQQFYLCRCARWSGWFMGCHGACLQQCLKEIDYWVRMLIPDCTAKAIRRKQIGDIQRLSSTE